MHTWMTAGTTRMTAGTTRMTAGTTRMTAGTTRMTAGTTRMTAGTTRMTAGTTRMTAGTTRMTAGTTRMTAGTTRMKRKIVFGLLNTVVMKLNKIQHEDIATFVTKYHYLDGNQVLLKISRSNELSSSQDLVSTVKLGGFSWRL